MRIANLLLLAALVAAWITTAACDDGAGADESRSGIYVFDLATGGLTRVSSDPAFALSWSEDGASIWYATNFLPGSEGTVRSLDVSTGERRDVLDLEGGGFASISRRGAVAYVAREADAFYAESATASGLKRRYGPGIGAEINPDGSRVLYLAPPCAGAQELFVAPADSTGEPRSVAAGAFAASWLPDGRIAYAQQQPDAGLPAIAMVLGASLRDARPASELLGVEPNGAYFLSPDASRVLLGSADNQILLRDIGAETEADLGSGRPALVGWSPDSALLAYASFHALHVVSNVGAERFTLDLTQMTDGTAKPFALAWSPDGRRIAISSADLPEGAACAALPPSATAGP